MTKSYKKLLKKKVAFVFFESLRVIASSELVEAPRLSSDNVEQKSFFQRQTERRGNRFNSLFAVASDIRPVMLIWVIVVPAW